MKLKSTVLTKLKSIHSLRALTGTKFIYRNTPHHLYHHAEKWTLQTHLILDLSMKKTPKELNLPMLIKSSTGISHWLFLRGLFFDGSLETINNTLILDGNKKFLRQFLKLWIMKRTKWSKRRKQNKNKGLMLTRRNLIAFYMVTLRSWEYRSVHSGRHATPNSTLIGIFWIMYLNDSTYNLMFLPADWNFTLKVVIPNLNSFSWIK